MEGPGPGFAYGAANHGVEGAGLADGAQIDVDEDAAEHDEGGDVVENVADGYGDSAESFCARPEDDAGDEVDDAAGDDLPEHSLLAGIEEAGVGRIHFFFAAGDSFYVAQPARVAWGPKHRLNPVEGLQGEEEDEGYAEVGVHDAAELSAAEDGSEPAEEPGKIYAEAAEEREKEKESDGPVKDAGVDGMAEEFSAINGGSAGVLEGLAGFIVEVFDGSARH